MTDAPPPAAREALLDHLLGLHRRRVNDLLARGAYEQARAYWEAAQSLPALAAQNAPALADDLTARAAAFRDALATEYLVTTREAMQKVNENLADDGVVILNMISAVEGEGSLFLQAEYQTFQEVFPQVFLFKVRAERDDETRARRA